jgi:hypothetical protein
LSGSEPAAEDRDEEDEADSFKFTGDEEDYEMPSYFSTRHRLNRFGAAAAGAGGSQKRRLDERVLLAFPLRCAGGRGARIGAAPAA